MSNYNEAAIEAYLPGGLLSCFKFGIADLIVLLYQLSDRLAK